MHETQTLGRCPPHSPDLAPCDFQLLPKWFAFIQDPEAASTAQLKTLKKEDSRAAAGRDEDDGMLVLEAMGGF